MFNYKKYCVLCKNEFTEFLINGKDFPILKLLCVVGAGRRRSRCPFCRSKDRERLVYLFLKEKTTVFTSRKKQRILHIAPEPALGKILKNQKNIEYVSGDLNPKKAENIINIEHMPYKNNTFELIICNHVLEHVTNDYIAMLELFRILKINGTAILQVPYAKKLKFTIEDKNLVLSRDRETYFGQKDHLRIYSLYSYASKLRKVGFVVKKINFTKYLAKKVINRTALNSEEILIICTKPG
jgi:SAM-dependent methyltransferase